MKPRMIAASLPREKVPVVIAYQEGLDRVWFQDEGADEPQLNMQHELQQTYEGPEGRI